MKKRSIFQLLALALVLPLFCGALLGDCGLNRADFECISVNGFEVEDNADDWNDYPWSMAYFEPDGKADGGHIYVGTGNGIDQLVMDRFGLLDGESPLRPPEIRRYRPDQGAKSWERVFDYREVDEGPEFGATGFRCMQAYRNQSDGVNYLYASTFGSAPSVLRSATGEPGSWEQFWSSGSNGSIRWLTIHNGLLYIAISNDLVEEPTPGQIWASDGETVWPVMQGGFGNPLNRAIMTMVSFNGWLYAATANAVEGFELWRLEGPDKQADPILVADAGITDSRNEAASTLCVFNDRLYLGTMIFAGRRFRGCDLIRFDQQDNWEVIVGPSPLSGFQSGFNNRFNAYLWWLEEHDGWLYAGTWDSAAVLQVAIDMGGTVDIDLAQLIDMIREFSNAGTKRDPAIVGTLTQGGGDLWKSHTGTHWFPVFTNGLGDTYNYGVRTMVSVEDELFLGFANPFDGLEVWRAQGGGN